ncbi:ATP-dependent DNA helicase [Corynebacterium uterequi]|uniref:ATP-dependent helicase DinG n=1 Tax=Corynebacterium uterequi TaxID=1072256 RepID=A0A0G3HKX6_9CORY|nr:ATP-dependent DNA helicase [Corynebacterium uterequi]AKK11757.1 DNA helicase, Rad3 [Corynebacterium uterequi]
MPEPDEAAPLSTEELLAAAVSAIGGSPRPGQERMASAVDQALDVGRHLAVQAGTGTGKSMAYLVPAIRYAQEEDATVVVSTATLGLQNQLVHRDLPRLADALEPHLSRRPSFAILKGRSNYVCLHKVSDVEDLPEGESLLDAGQLSRLGAHAERVRQWAQQTETGDRDDLTPGVPNIVWRAFSVTAKECLGAARCPHGEECFATLARAAASEKDIVVTNHALLAIDALSDFAILPDHDAVIIDEAHELDGRITSVATSEISPHGISLAAKRGEKLDAAKRSEELREISDDLEAMLAIQPEGRWTSLDDTARTSLTGLASGLWRLREDIQRGGHDGESESDPERAAERQNLTNHLLELHDAVVRILDVFAEGSADPTTARDVVWLQRTQKEQSRLAVAPLSIAGLLRESLFADHTVVLTSATLTVGGNFNAMAAAWGLPRGSWDHLDAGTPFDPAASGILYQAAHLPKPGRDGLSAEALDEMTELILAAGGRTLGLFSSRRAAEQAAEALRPRLPFDILLQGEDTIGALVARFQANENTCLFGTLTLWQGVDVPGPSLSLVIIDRIPFPRPDDPLLKARSEAADAAGRNGFMEVSATHAGLLLAQGTGRLLRSVTDRGVVAVLDSRLATARYGGFLRRSMPAFWTTTSLEVVTGALRRLVAAPRK